MVARRSVMVLAAAAGLALAGLPVAAHHSFQAEYDGSKVVTIKGVVKRVAWVNPHAYVYVEAMDETGKITNWAFESLSPNALSIRGWSKSSLKEGDQVTVEAYLAKDGKPLADGSLHANSRLITLADGRKVFAGSSADDSATK
jgi:Family of unknown function (DUF6152)